MINHMRITVVLCFMGFLATPVWANQQAQPPSSDRPTPILTLEQVLAQVEQAHPLLQGSQTQKMVARGKLLKALGAFEPTLVNDWELEPPADRDWETPVPMSG